MSFEASEDSETNRENPSKRNGGETRLQLVTFDHQNKEQGSNNGSEEEVFRGRKRESESRSFSTLEVKG